ncbi:MAG: pyridoxamine 5'-phosphate oxidase family protein [Nitrospinae bacterium]|nr:pyridoxamine 5'-phosphate oxidase family protein [Nitrospinota bacterium]
MNSKNLEADEKSPTVALLEVAEAAYVATIGEDGYPDVRAMFNLRKSAQFPDLAPLFKGHDKDLALYFTTNSSSRKTRQILNDKRATAYYAIPAEFTGLSLTGDMEVVSNPDEKRRVWQKGWELYYPGGVEDPDHTVLRMRPKRGIYYCRLERQILDFGRR